MSSFTGKVGKEVISLWVKLAISTNDDGHVVDALIVELVVLIHGVCIRLPCSHCCDTIIPSIVGMWGGHTKIESRQTTPRGSQG